MINIAVIGSGTMGSGIAQVAATAGCTVKLYDVNDEALHKSKTALERIMTRLVEKERITADEKERVLQSISYVNSLSDLADADLTIEAIVENVEIKKKVFVELESLQSDKAVIASNTSSLSIASLAASLKKPERFIGI